MWDDPGDILQDEWAPLRNPGTQNNFIGVPMALLKLNGRNKSAVIELGMNRPREIGALSKIASPNIGVITNIGPSHLEKLKTLHPNPLLKDVEKKLRELDKFFLGGNNLTPVSTSFNT